MIVGRTMIGNHFKKKFSKRPPPGIIVTAAENRVFENLISTYGTARPFKTQSYKICLLYTSPSPRDNPASRMPSSA